MAESLCCSPETVTTLASLVAQTVKNLLGVQKTRARSLGREDPLEEEMATHSSVLAWRIPWMGYTHSTRLQRIGRNRATNAHTTTLLISYNPVQNKKLKVWRGGTKVNQLYFSVTINDCSISSHGEETDILSWITEPHTCSVASPNYYLLPKRKLCLDWWICLEKVHPPL